MNLVRIFECVAALLAVDFVSGLVHWAEDTFGTVATPIFGRWIVAPNVSHHVDPTAFVSKSWLASSWDLSLAALLLAGTALLTGHLDAGIALFAVVGANANEIHKWNHAPSRAPRAARVLWAAGLLQRPAQHARHHAREKNTHYCVITPFVNPVLDRTGFWRALERVLVPVFGAPRRDDLRTIAILPWIRRRSSRPYTPHHLLLVCLGSLLFDLPACTERDVGVVRPTLDHALLRPTASAPRFDFAHAEPPILPAHHAPLLRHFEGVQRGHGPNELDHEITAWEYEKLTRDQRRDPETNLPNHFPKNWKPERTWYAGELQGLVKLVYVPFDDATYAIGAARHPDEWRNGEPSTEPVQPKQASLGWSSTSEPARVTWIERDFVLPALGGTFAYDAARHGGELVVVCAVSEGLREYAFEARAGVLVEKRRRLVSSPRSYDPRLLEVGPDLLLFWWEFRAKSSRWLQGGCALNVSRLTAGSSGWSAPVTLTIDLDHHFAVCARGEQVTAAWSDDRYEEMEGWGFVYGHKLVLATSLDRGATWSAPVLLHDPEDREAAADGSLFVLDDGARIFVSIPWGRPAETKAGTAADTYVISRDLARWAPAPERMFESLVELRRAEIASWPR